MLTEPARRILAHLGEPRSLLNLTRVLRADDYAPFDANDNFDAVRDDVAKELDRLIERGLVVTVGSHQDAKSLLRAVRTNDDAIDIPKPKAEALASRLDSGRDSRLDTGGLVILSKQGLETLRA